MSAPAMTRMTAREALTAAIAHELRASPTTVFLGETVRGPGAAGVAAGLYEEFGPGQVIETPVSENGIFGAVLGMALAGMRPIVEIYSADFLLAVANEVINDMAKWRHQQTTPGELPITIRGCMGANGGLGPEHSQCVEAYFHHAPGLTIVAPGTAADAAGLLTAAIRSPEPVIVLEHRRVYDLVGDVPEDHDVELGAAAVVREGHDVTIVAWAWMRTEAERAAAALAAEGISAEVVDLRTVRPIDWATVFGSVAKTGRLVVAEESPLTGCVGAEIVARVAERGLATAVARVAMPDVIHPYSATMEHKILPDCAAIVAATREICAA
jgi:pyruvate/2-oxoglutarate/acetoin dehydrogenase E1 component